MTSPLITINNSTISTYAYLSLTANFGLRRTFRGIFTIADMKPPILGAVFFASYNLVADVHTLILVVMKTCLSV